MSALQRLGLLAWVCVCAPAVAAQNRLWLAELELVGPVGELECELGAAGLTRVEGELAQGARRRLQLQLPCSERPDLGPRDVWIEPELSWSGAGEVSFLGWVEAPAQERLRPALSPALLARSRPALSPARPRPRALELLLLAASAVAVIALRRRPAAAVLVGIGTGALLLLLPRERPAPARVQLVEALHGQPLALWVTSSWEASAQESSSGGELHVLPPGRALEFRHELDSGLWSAHAPDASLHRLRRTPTPELPDAGGERLADAWLRSAGGETRWLGAWERELERPASSAGAGSPPPGWLLAGLPLGSVVLLARDAEGGWLRLAGLP